MTDTESLLKMIYELFLMWLGAAIYWMVSPTDQALPVVGAMIAVGYLALRLLDRTEPTIDSGGELANE